MMRLFQQLCIDAGLSHDQLLALQPGLQQLSHPFRHLLEQLGVDDDDDDTPDAEVEAEVKEQTVALQQRLTGQFCEGESQVGALEAWVRLFDWRCRCNIKVGDQCIGPRGMRAVCAWSLNLTAACAGLHWCITVLSDLPICAAGLTYAVGVASLRQSYKLLANAVQAVTAWLGMLYSHRPCCVWCAVCCQQQSDPGTYCCLLLRLQLLLLLL